MMDLQDIVRAMLSELARAFGHVYPPEALSQIVRAGEEARRRTAYQDGKRAASIKAMEDELQRIERSLFPQ